MWLDRQCWVRSIETQTLAIRSQSVSFIRNSETSIRFFVTSKASSR